MKRVKILAGLLTGVLLASVNVLANGFVSEPIPSLDVQGYEWEQIYQTNHERIKRGLQPLTTFSELNQATRIRSKELITKFDHKRPNGSDCYSVLREKHIPYGWCGENIAAGYSSPQDVTGGWMISAGHRENILTPEFSHIGMGYYYQKGTPYTHYWTQLFTGTCSFSSLRVYSMEEYRIGEPVSKVEAQKGTRIQELGLAGTVDCIHGTTFFPLDEELCTGYDAKKADKNQKVTLRSNGLKTTFTVRLHASLDDQTAPTLNRKAEGRTAVQLKWSEIKGAKKYQLYRKTGKSGTYKKIAELSRTSYTDKKAAPGTQYWYRVRAINGKELGKYSINRSITLTPEIPALLKVTPRTGRNTVAWTPVMGADGYEIWCKTGKNSYKKVRNLLSGERTDANHFFSESHGTYTYKVRAFWNVNGKRVCSGYSKTKTLERQTEPV